MICVLNERAQARNLGGTAKAAFRPKAGRRAAFFNIGGLRVLSAVQGGMMRGARYGCGDQKGVNDSDETQRSGDSD